MVVCICSDKYTSSLKKKKKQLVAAFCSAEDREPRDEFYFNIIMHFSTWIQLGLPLWFYNGFQKAQVWSIENS